MVEDRDAAAGLDTSNESNVGHSRIQSSSTKRGRLTMMKRKDQPCRRSRQKDESIADVHRRLGEPPRSRHPVDDAGRSCLRALRCTRYCRSDDGSGMHDEASTSRDNSDVMDVAGRHLWMTKSSPILLVRGADDAVVPAASWRSSGFAP
jgi:hypothetical protein